MLVEALMKEEEEIKSKLAAAFRKEEEERTSSLVAAFKKEQEQMRKHWLDQGIAIGEAKGEARGEAKGEARGETKRDRQIARTMAASNYSLATIAHLLGISEEDVQRLLSDEQTN